jgi:VWFA-related protein
VARKISRVYANARVRCIMNYRPHRKWIFLTLSSLLAISTSARAQSGNDPWSGASPSGTSGVLGVPLPTEAPSTETVSRRADAGKQLEFKSQTSLVQVPVVVTDKAGGHIHQLTKGDFKILEDGKVQSIVSFEEIVPDKSVVPGLSRPAGTFTNLTADESKPRSVTVMVLDKVNTPFLNQAYARGQLIKYLANHLDLSQPLGLMAIGSKGVTVLSGLSSDPATLIAALKKASGETSQMEQFSNDAQAIASSGDPPDGLMGGIRPGDSPDLIVRKFILKQDAVDATFGQARAIETTLQAFLSIAWSLSGIPGRKSLVWATGGFPFYLDSFASVPGDNALRLLYERALKALNDAQISVYPLDVRGLVTNPMYGGDYAGSLVSEDAPDLLRESTQNSLKNFARMTGGVAYYGNNDLAGAFSRAAQDSSSYYLLSYYFDHRNNKPGWRQLQVTVSRKDAEVHARAGYLVSDVAVNPELSHKSDVAFALNSPFESTGIPVTARWEGFQPDGPKKKVGFTLQVPATDLINEADKNRYDLEFIAQATNQGTPAGGAGQTIKGAVRPDALAKLKAEGIFYTNALELPPGKYQVRFVVRDNLSGRLGSVIVPLTVN